MSGTLKVGGKTLATHDTDTNVAKIQLGSTSDVVLTDSAGNNVLSESGGVVTLTADEANVGSNALVVDSSGKVGIGANSPYSQLDIYSAIVGPTSGEATGVGSIRITNGTGSLSSAGGLEFKVAGNTNGYGAKIQALNSGGAQLVFANRFASGTWLERMRIDSSGNLLVGTTGEIRNANDLGVSIEPEGRIYLGRGASSGGFAHLVFVNSNGTVGSVVTANNATSYNTSSDYRLKENIREITDGITRVKQLNPSRFNFIADPDNTVDGFIAHEVQDIVPEAVSGEKDAVDSDGKPEYQGVDYGRITPLLTAALKEAIAKIEMLETRIALLESK